MTEPGPRRHLPYVIFTFALWMVVLPGVLVLDAGGRPPWRGPVGVSIAILIAVGGLRLIVAGSRRLARAGVQLFGVRPGPVLVTDDLYGRLRNPIDVGATLLAFASWLALDLALGWVVPAAALVSFVAGAGPYEDRLLLEEFEDEFRAYRRSVPKWWPRRTAP